MHIRQTILTFFLLLFSILLHGQSILQGRVYDSETDLPIPGVAIIVDSLRKGAITDENGIFRLELNNGQYNLSASYLGYKDYETTVRINESGAFVNIQLIPEAIDLGEVAIFSQFARERETPVAMTNIKPEIIESQLGNQDYPELMKLVPGVYATKLGGGTGDARISIRGFQQENIALLLNGVPVGSVENGLVYWSNWAGLGDATQTIQVQRGLGASRVALNSVGGTINIITKGSGSRKGGSIKYSMSDFGNQKTIISLSTGQTDNGFALNFLGSYTNGPGYVDATHVKAYAYFLNISKQINSRQSLVFTALGAPERHGQRTYGLTNEEYNLYGNKYNPNWGMFNGKILSLAENFYHKPQLSLNHYLSLNKGLLSTSVYYSMGDGGGHFSEAFMSAPALSFRKNNQIDWDAIYLQNTTHQDSAQLADGSYVKGFSKIVRTNYLASHFWVGAMSNLNYNITENLKLITGIHFRYFKSNLREEISDLMGGNFWIDNYYWSLAGVAGREQIKGVGDIINVDNDSRVDIGSYFAQLEYQWEKLSLFAASTVSAHWYKRYDRINYVGNTGSELVTKGGFDVKVGSNYNINPYNNLYFNAGYYSKAPYFKFVFANFSNAVVENLANEKISAVELGYGFRKQMSSFNLNLYYTLWEDKSLLSRENIQLDENHQTRALIRGLDALHKGIELDGSVALLHNLDLGLTASFGDWKWINDVEAELYDNNQVLIDSTTVYSDGLWVGDAPQVQLGMYADLKLPMGFSFNATWLYFDRIYANFDPAGRNNPEDREQPYRIPSYNTLDLHLLYDFPISTLNSTLGISVYNLTNKESVMRGEDGATHELDTFTGFWSPGRTFNFSLKIAF